MTFGSFASAFSLIGGFVGFSSISKSGFLASLSLKISSKELTSGCSILALKDFPTSTLSISDIFTPTIYETSRKYLPSTFILNKF